MRLKFKTPFQSIRNFEEVTLPNLTIVTGLNGAGKTHLLQAIAQNYIEVDRGAMQKAIYFDSSTFSVQTHKSKNKRALGQPNNTKSSESMLISQDNAWKALNKYNLKTNAEKAYKTAFTKDNTFYPDEKNGLNWNTRHNDLWESSKNSEKYIWHKSLNPDHSLMNQARSIYQKKIEKLVFKHNDFITIENPQDVIRTCRKINKPIHLITKDEFFDHHVDRPNSGNFLSFSLSAIFTKYKIRQYDWVHSEYERLGDKAPKQTKLYAQFEKRCPKPWILINDILQNLNQEARGSQKQFNFSITTPDKDTLSMGTYRNYKFEAQLLDNSSGEIRDFNNLSSGESILMALAMSIYESEENFEFPSLILLDEIDAFLHPSMTLTLLKTIKTIFSENNIKVIMATHSPSTLALCEEEAIYVLNKQDKTHSLKKESQKDAMEIVSEGFATLETGLTLFNEVAKHDLTIITEGNNAGIIEHVLNLFEKRNISVAKCFKGNSGKDQLKTMYQFFKQVNHQKPVLFVWDCDVKGVGDEANNTYALILPKNSGNELASKGIENCFFENDLEQFTQTVIDSRGNESKSFDLKRKADFEAYILAKSDQGSFQFFEPLIKKIEEIIASK